MPANKKVAKKLGANKPVIKAKPKNPYHLEVEVNDVVFKTDAKSIEEALSEFVASPEYPVGAKTITIMRYSKGKTERQRVLHVPEARRMLRTISLKPDYLGVVAEKMQAELNA